VLSIIRLAGLGRCERQYLLHIGTTPHPAGEEGSSRTAQIVHQRVLAWLQKMRLLKPFLDLGTPDVKEPALRAGDPQSIAVVWAKVNGWPGRLAQPLDTGTASKGLSFSELCFQSFTSMSIRGKVQLHQSVNRVLAGAVDIQ